MNKIIAGVLAILWTLLGFATLSEGQTAKNEGLSDRQKSIVTIAAFTAKGDLEKLKAALKIGRAHV